MTGTTMTIGILVIMTTALTTTLLKRHLPRKEVGATALALEEEVLVLYRRVLPSDHPNVAASMGNLATMYINLGRHDDALVLVQELLALQRRVRPPDHPDVADSLAILATTYRFLNRFDDAVSHYEQAIGIWSRSLPPGHPNMKHARADLRNAQAAAAQRSDSVRRAATTKSQLQAKLAQRRKHQGPEGRSGGQVQAAPPVEDRSMAELLAFIGGDPPASSSGSGSKTAPKSKSKKGGNNGKGKTKKKR